MRGMLKFLPVKIGRQGLGRNAFRDGFVVFTAESDRYKGRWKGSWGEETRPRTSGVLENEAPRFCCHCEFASLRHCTPLAVPMQNAMKVGRLWCCLGDVNVDLSLHRPDLGTDIR